MTWEREPRCIAVLEPVERQTAHLVFDDKVIATLNYILGKSSQHTKFSHKFCDFLSGDNYGM